MKNIMDSKTLKPLRLYTHTHTHISNALKENKRIKYIDIARGITIILMIIGHVLETGWKRSVIFSFHMPLFIIISGLFYREKSLKENIKNIFLKLMLPYIITTLVVKICLYNHTQSILYCLKDWINQIVFSYSYWGRVQFAPEVERLSILWFFPLLAIIRLMFFFLKKCSKDNSIRLFFLCITVTYLGYLLGKTGYWLPFSIDVAMLSTIFYYIGYLLNQKHILEKILLDGKSLILIMFIWLLGVKYNWIELAGRNYLKTFTTD